MVLAREDTKCGVSKQSKLSEIAFPKRKETHYFKRRLKKEFLL